MTQQLDILEKTLLRNSLSSPRFPQLSQASFPVPPTEKLEDTQQSSTSMMAEEITIPLSPGQRNLWFFSSLGADKSAAYNESVVLRLSGELQLSALKAALQAVVDRRDALRIISINGKEQTITSNLQVNIPYLDLTAELEPMKQQLVNTWLQTAASVAFDLNQGPFFRIQLVRLDQQDYRMVIVLHHLIADGWSIEVIVQELAEFYSALCTQTPKEKPQARQFRYYIEWLIATQTTQQVNIDTSYWVKVFQTAIPTLTLPTDRPELTRTYNGDRKIVTLDNALYEKLKHFSKEQGTTIFMTLLAAWKVLLSGLSGQQQLVVGVPSAGQVLSKAKDLVGHCSCVLPIISEPVYELVFTEFLASVKKTLLDVYEHQSFFFTDVSLLQSQAVNVPAVLVIFNIDKFREMPKLYQLEAKLEPSPVCFAKHHLSLNGLQYENKFVLEFFYRTDLFDSHTMNEWCGSFVTLLKGILDSPETELYQLLKQAEIKIPINGGIAHHVQETQKLSVKDDSFVAPSNPFEEVIAQSVQQILRKSLVSVHDNFFDLGLQSLQGAQLVSRIQTILAVDISLGDLFEAPTVASIAAKIRGRASQPLPPILTTKSQFSDYQLSSAQRSLWVHAQMDSSAIAYNLCMSLLLEGDLHIEALQKAFEAVIVRHESLRTTFILVEDEPRQRIHDTIIFPYEVIDLSNAKNPEQQACEYGLQEGREPFDLTRGPLLRTNLLKLSDAKYVLLLTIHHIIIDGWSLQILEQEVFYYYQAYKSGSKPQLPPLRIQYKDYAAWHNALLQTDRIRKQRNYWQNKLSGVRPNLNLPTDFARPPVTTFTGSVISRIFDRSLTTALNSLSRKCSASLYILLVAIVKTLFYRITQQNDLSIGTSFAERPHPDLEGQIGYFINPLVLRDAIAGNQTFLSVLHQVRQTILEALDNALYPFDALVNELQQGENVVQRSSLFEVQVVLHNHPQTDTQRHGLLVSTFQNVVLASRFDLIFNFIESDDQLRLELEYKTDLWKPERIEVIQERLHTLVMDIVTHPEKRLDDLNFQTSYEAEAEETDLVFNLDF